MNEKASIAVAAPLASNLPEYSVGEISRAIRQTLEADFRQVRVRGEITNFKRHGSGHLYFCLKDEEALLDGCCWRQTATRLAIRPEDGMEVVCTGRVSTYPGRSKYQLIVESMELAGEGALLKLLEDRRRKLAAEGLFDESRKRPLPYLPEVIGVITSPTGAVIRDILHRLRDRFPRTVLLWPVAVQGEAAAAQVAAAIEGFNRIPNGGPVPRPEVLIVARGGGSLEDLWAFNEEIVVRAAAASRIPLIAAVGHETDYTLIDHAADRRAPTPSAAAEMAVPVRAELLAQVLDRARRMIASADRLFEERRHRIEGLARGLPEPTALIETAVQRLDDRAERLANALENQVHRRAARIAELGGRLRHPREQIAHKEQLLVSCGQALARAGEGLLVAKERSLERLAVEQRLGRAVERRVGDWETGLGHLGTLLESYSYDGVLRRGFALVRHDDHLVAAAADVEPGMALDLQFADGNVAAVAGREAERTATPKRRAPVRRDGAAQKQGVLL